MRFTSIPQGASAPKTRVSTSSSRAAVERGARAIMQPGHRACRAWFVIAAVVSLEVLLGRDQTVVDYDGGDNEARALFFCVNQGVGEDENCVERLVLAARELNETYKKKKTPSCDYQDETCARAFAPVWTPKRLGHRGARNVPRTSSKVRPRRLTGCSPQVRLSRHQGRRRQPGDHRGLERGRRLLRRGALAAARPGHGRRGAIAARGTWRAGQPRRLLLANTMGISRFSKSTQCYR